MDANIRELKANLSSVIRKVEAGETVTVSVRNRRVARIVPIADKGALNGLVHLPGLAWRGGKPLGLARGERLPRGVELSDWGARNRR